MIALLITSKLCLDKKKILNLQFTIPIYHGNTCVHVISKKSKSRKTLFREKLHLLWWKCCDGKHFSARCTLACCGKWFRTRSRPVLWRAVRFCVSSLLGEEGEDSLVDWLVTLWPPWMLIDGTKNIRLHTFTAAGYNVDMGTSRPGVGATKRFLCLNRC